MGSGKYKTRTALATTVHGGALIAIIQARSTLARLVIPIETSGARLDTTRAVWRLEKVGGALNALVAAHTRARLARDITRLAHRTTTLLALTHQNLGDTAIYGGEALHTASIKTCIRTRICLMAGRWLSGCGQSTVAKPEI